MAVRLRVQAEVACRVEAAENPRCRPVTEGSAGPAHGAKPIPGPVKLVSKGRGVQPVCGRPARRNRETSNPAAAARRVTWDVTEHELPTAETLKRGNGLEPLDYSVIKTNGLPKELVNSHHVGSINLAEVIAWQAGTYGENGPATGADSWDVKRHRGKRSMFQQVNHALQAATMAPRCWLCSLGPWRPGKGLERARPFLAPARRPGPAVPRRGCWPARPRSTRQSRAVRPRARSGCCALGPRCELVRAGPSRDAPG